MNTKALERPKIPFNGKMLQWARKWRGRTIEEAANKVNVSAEKILAWEDPNDTIFPTIRQGRILAEFYDRAFLEFFYDVPPHIIESGLIPDFRVHRDARDPSEIREILEIQHWAEAQKLNALELYEDIGEKPPDFPSELRATINSDIESIAILARAEMSFSIHQQKRLLASEIGKLPTILRSKMEDIGLLVLRENKLSKHNVSGFCLAEFPLPVIVYGKEAPSRQAFTLMHEFAHVILRESAISSNQSSRKARNHQRKVEKWCNKFAAAFLIPKLALSEFRIVPNKPAAAIEDEALTGLSKAFRVSNHAMLIRLVDLKYVEANYYWSRKRPEFIAEEEDWNGFGRPKYWAGRIVNQLGSMYTGLVLEAWGTDKIPFHHAVDYMGLKNPAHLTEIKREFNQS